MKVTKFNYPMEKNLIEKIDLMIKRCENKDTVLLVDGEEGEGKTTMSIAIAYYVSEQMNREFDQSHVFFDLNKLIPFAQNNTGKIIIWDEPALNALSTDSRKRIVKNLTRILMMARKKNHFIMINTARFYRFNEYSVVDRPIGMVHVYSRKNIHSGRFVYIKKKYLEHLYRDCKYKKRKTFKKYASKRVRGTFPNVLDPDYKNNVCDDFGVDKYESRKDYAIQSIGKEDEKESKWKKKFERLKGEVALIPKNSDITYKKLAKAIQYSEQSLYNWQKFIKKYDLR